MTDHLAFITAELSALRPLRDFSGIEPEDDLIVDLGLDSLDLVTLALAIEEQFNIDVPDSAIRRWRSVADVLACLASAAVQPEPHP